MDAPQDKDKRFVLWTLYFELIGQSNLFGLTASSSTLQYLSNYVAICMPAILPCRNALVGGGSVLAVWSVVIGATSIAGTSNFAANIALSVFMMTWSMLYTGSVCCLKIDPQIVQREREEKRREEPKLLWPTWRQRKSQSSGTLSSWISLSKGRIQISAKLKILGFHNMCLFHFLLC
jgi:hypothetical protein